MECETDKCDVDLEYEVKKAHAEDGVTVIDEIRVLGISTVPET